MKKLNENIHWQCNVSFWTQLCNCNCSGSGIKWIGLNTTIYLDHGDSSGAGISDNPCRVFLMKWFCFSTVKGSLEIDVLFNVAISCCLQRFQVSPLSADVSCHFVHIFAFSILQSKYARDMFFIYFEENVLGCIREVCYNENLRPHKLYCRVPARWGPSKHVRRHGSQPFFFFGLDLDNILHDRSLLNP